MKSRVYVFHSEWKLAAPKRQVWDSLAATPAAWAEWWPQLSDVQGVKLRPGLNGSRFSCIWQSPTGYQLRSDIVIGEAVEPKQVTMHSDGDLRGTVSCRLSQSRGLTTVKIRWHVETTKPWMNRLTPLLRPVFVWSHHYVMRSGERGLRHYLAVQTKLPAGIQPAHKPAVGD